MPGWDRIFIKNINPRELAARSVNFGMSLSGPVIIRPETVTKMKVIIVIIFNNETAKSFINHF